MYDADSGTMRVLYTAVGARAEVGRSFRQRLFETRGTVIADAVSDWSTHLELLPVADPYLRTEPGACSAEVCRAYRDPFFFQDPVTGHQHLVFAASVSDPAQPHAGAIGLATWRLGRWQPDPPLLTALGVNRELERPHLLARDNRYYLFVSTHGHSFTVDHPAPSGLYGFTAPPLTGPWEPLNDTGIVLANPPEAPQAHYAWQVLPDLRIVSFGNYPHEPPGTLAEDAAFAGSIPPFRHLRIDGSRTQVS